MTADNEADTRPVSNVDGGVLGDRYPLSSGELLVQSALDDSRCSAEGAGHRLLLPDLQ